jgi:hypothetical protein
MNGTPAAALLAVLCAFAAGEGGKGGAAPPAAGDLTTVKSDLGTWEFQCPSGFTEEEPKKSGVVKQLLYGGKPYLTTRIKVYTYEGYTKPEHLEGFMKFLEKNIGGNVTYEPDSKNMFCTDIQFSGNWWISQVDGRIEPPCAYAIECVVPKETYEETRDVWLAVAGSFKTSPPPKDPFEVPTGWKMLKNPMFGVLGPMGDLKDKKSKDFLERRLAQLQTMLDVDQPATKLYRQVFNDERKAFARCPIHVHVVPEAFKAEAGDRWVEGAGVLYLPDSPERVLLVNGSPEGGFRDEDVLAEAGVQYAESRIGRMWPWLRAAFHLYFDAGIKSRGTPGLFPPEMMKRGKEVFAKAAIPFDDLMKKDEAGMAALGEDGRVLAWGLLQYGLHGPDGPTRNLFRGFLRDGVGSPDLNAVWEKCVARHKEETKKVFRTKDFDLAAKKWFRDMKEEKR